MLSRAITPKRRGRKPLAALATLSLLVGLFAYGGTALAVHADELFELDVVAAQGNANTADGAAAGEDWATIYASLSGGATDAFGVSFITDPVGAAENSYYTGGGSKDINDVSGKGGWQYGTANDPIPDKDDIVHAFAAAYVNPDDDHTNVYFGMDRYDNNGDAEAGFWFFKGDVSLGTAPNFNGVHQVGDVLVLINWGGSNPVGEMTVYEWVGGKSPLLLLADNLTADCALVGATDNFCGVANRTIDNPPWDFIDKGGSADIRPLELLEAGIDLNALLGDDICFSSFLASTRSSHSTTAQLKDFALGGFESCGAEITTQVSDEEIFVGETVQDTATITVSGGPNPPAPTGTVSFTVNDVAFDTESLAGVVPVGDAYSVTTSVSYTATAAGTFCFEATWPGDVNYTDGPYIDDGTNECFDVVKRPSTTVTTSSPTGGNVVPGTSVSDTATVTSTSGQGPTPTGTVKFFLCQPATVTTNGGDCSAGGDQIGTPAAGEGLNGSGVAQSESTTNTNAIGTYCWRAEYSGDSVYDPSSHTNNSTECFTTVKQPSQTSTASSQQGVVLPGASVTDTATVTGSGPTPTGTVDFFLCAPATVTTNGGDCSAGGTKIGATKNLVAGVATSDAASGASTTANGKYCWRAVYSGDAFYIGSNHTNSTTECFSVQDTTTASSAQDWLPNDSATITSTGGSALNGTLSMQLYTGATCGVSSGSAVAGQLYSTTLIDAASPASFSTSNLTYKVTGSGSVSWLVTFTSSDANVGSDTHCESTTLTITN